MMVHHGEIPLQELPPYSDGSASDINDPNAVEDRPPSYAPATAPDAGKDFHEVPLIDESQVAVPRDVEQQGVPRNSLVSRSKYWRRLIFAAIPYFLLNIGFAIWISRYTKWKTQPYNYPRWIFDGIWADQETASVMATIFLSFVNGGLAIWFIIELFDVRGSKARSSNRGCLWFIGVPFVILTCIWPGTTFEVAPQNAWHKMMKNTCEHFDLRTKLDGWSGRPNATLYLSPVGKSTVLPPFYIGLHEEYTPNNNTELYSQYYRISGSTHDTENITVDFDLNNRIWRMLHWNKTDLPNMWTAKKDKDSPLRHGFTDDQMQLSSATPIKYGTWSNPTTMLNHTLKIPELDLYIPHWYEFTQSSAYEPFLKFHRTSYMTDGEKQNLVDSKWTKNNDETVLMRTASFGHGKAHPSVCIRNADWREDGKVVKGLGDDMLVPLGLLQVYRLRLSTENLRADWESKYFPVKADQKTVT